MSKMIRTPDDAIRMLGGPTKAAEWARVTPNAVIWWRKRGIPPSVHVRLMVEARLQGYEIDPEIFGLEDDEWREFKSLFLGEMTAAASPAA